MFVALKECDINDDNIPQDVKDFCDQVNKDFWPMGYDPFTIHVSECNDHDYSLIFCLENICIYVDNFGTSDIKKADVGVSFKDMPRQRIYAAVGDVPRNDVGKRAVDLYHWVAELVDNPDMNFLDMRNCT